MGEVMEIFGLTILTSDYYHQMTDYTIQLQNQLSISGNHSYQTDAEKSRDRYFEVCRQRDQYKAEAEIASLKIDAMKEIYDTQVTMLKSVIEDLQRTITDSRKAVDMVLRDDATGKIKGESGRTQKEQKAIILEKYVNGYFDSGTDEEKRARVEQLSVEMSIKPETVGKYLREVAKEWKKRKVKVFNPDPEGNEEYEKYVFAPEIDRKTGLWTCDKNYKVIDSYYSSIVALPV